MLSAICLNLDQSKGLFGPYTAAIHLTTGYQHFLLFPQSFQKAFYLTLYHIVLTFNDPIKEPF